MATITVEQWLAELERLGVDGSDAEGVTISEIAQASGLGRSALRTRMRAAIDAGLAKCVGRRMVSSIDGRPTAVPVYQLMGGK